MERACREDDFICFSSLRSRRVFRIDALGLLAALDQRIPQFTFPLPSIVHSRHLKR